MVPRAKKPKAAKGEGGVAQGTQDAAVQGVEAYEVITVHRSQVQGAPYNPRQMSDEARKKLRKGMEKLGLLAPPTWNETTGHIVGGHQRMTAMDAIMGTDDYTLRVARVRMDLKAEGEANILLNNQQAQGDWDLDKLAALLKAPDVDFAATGFDVADVFRMFGNDAFGNADRQAEMGELSERLHKARDAYAKVVDKTSTDKSPHFFTVLIFETEAARIAFNAFIGVDGNRYQSGRRFQEVVDAALGVADDG